MCCHPSVVLLSSYSGRPSALLIPLDWPAPLPLPFLPLSLRLFSFPTPSVSGIIISYFFLKSLVYFSSSIFSPSIRFRILSISDALLTLAFVIAIFRILAFPSTPAPVGFSTRISAQPVWVEDCRIDQSRRLDSLRLVSSATLHWSSNRPGSFVDGIFILFATCFRTGHSYDSFVLRELQINSCV